MQYLNSKAEKMKNMIHVINVSEGQRGHEMCVRVCVCVYVCVCCRCFLPSPHLPVTFHLPVKLLRSTLLLLLPSSSLLLSLQSSFLLPSTLGDVFRAFYSSPRHLSLHSVTPSNSPSHCPFNCVFTTSSPFGPTRCVK